jgi:hypothetical protein
VTSAFFARLVGVVLADVNQVRLHWGERIERVDGA